MSLETLLALSTSLNMSLDYIVLGKDGYESEKLQHTDEVAAIIDMLNSANEKNQNYAKKLLKLFLSACQNN